MKPIRSSSHITALAALVLLAVFAVAILLTLLEGASVYRRMTDRDREAWQERTACGYLATRLRQEDRLGALSVEDFCGLPTLTLGADREYATRLYCYDGSLWELYAPTALALEPEDGERVMELSAMELELSGGLLTAQLTHPDGTRQAVILRPRCGEVAP